jgi:hypothetical protein
VRFWWTSSATTFPIRLEMVVRSACDRQRSAYDIARNAGYPKLIKWNMFVSWRGAGRIVMELAVEILDVGVHHNLRQLGCQHAGFPVKKI